MSRTVFPMSSRSRPAPVAAPIAALSPVLAAALLAVVGIGSLRAAELPAPTGRVILALTGSIANTNAPGRAEFDYAMLSGLGLVTRSIDTPWTDVGTRFEGVPAAALLAYVGATGRRVRAVAANDYRVGLPISDLTDHPTLLALSKDGERMRLRDKGPVWLLYDDEDRPDNIEEDLISRMVWQLRTLEVID